MLSLSLSIYIYIYIYIERKRERERERERNPIWKRPLDVCGLTYVKHPILLCKHMGDGMAVF